MIVTIFSLKSSEERIPKLSVECEGGADTANKKKGEPEVRPHLQKKHQLHSQGSRDLICSSH
jgi:hypothetical protein